MKYSQHKATAAKERRENYWKWNIRSRGHTMALPTAKEAQPFYQSALQRFEDAQYLLDGERTTAAIYLAGYSVECMLKALI
jgi:hypothetical protein